MRRAAGFTLVEALAVLTLLGVIATLLIPAIARSSRHSKLLTCEQHLHTMFEAQKDAPPVGPQGLGRVYWARLTQTTPPKLSMDALRCPFVEASEGPVCHYLGPSALPSTLKDGDPIGCDFDNNHSEDGREGGNVLLKSGQVVTDSIGHEGPWHSAHRQGKCRP